ncbi:MAG: DUF3800 domain-containing protein [Acidobacteria bacterium]|nr:DUF3800 domain-containing protein [Acidobacteriota bacterium]
MDESKQNKWLGFGGILIDSSKLLKFDRTFYSTLRNHNVPVNEGSSDDLKKIEIKWSLNNGWIKENLRADAKVRLYVDILNLINEFEITLISSEFDLPESRNFGYSEEKCRDESYIYLYERIEKYCELNKQTAFVIVDQETDPKTNLKRIKENYNLIKQGTKYVPLNHIYGHGFPISSYMHPGSQLADLIVGITTAFISNNQDKYAEQHWKYLKGKFMLLDINTPQRYGLCGGPKAFVKEWAYSQGAYTWPNASYRDDYDDDYDDDIPF